MISSADLRHRARSPLLDLVRLTPVMRRGAGAGPVSVEVVASAEDTPFLAAVTGFSALSICPLSPVVTRSVAQGCGPAELAGVLDVAGSARVLLVSVPLVDGTTRENRVLHEVLDEAAVRGVPVVAAAGAASSVLTRHPWVLPVLSCTASGRVSWFVDLDPDVEPRGLLAPGEDVPGPHGAATGNGIAAAVVAGAAALLWSLFPKACGGQVRSALLIGATHPRRFGPPLLDAERAHEFLSRHAG
ncbi:hypothetical protein [Actinokineospora iranica]|uniref:Subtilase family protein n=1 Tax=Actinokineospora iranica TaxID=1271860 RepID=A0A1G6INS0_9PSEU|nr:hypothetical protein [Actinokineospora iranica]SDC08137.1 hypothetical protein SAMN05216174_10136 [Actinokineospora iranica]